MERKGISNNLLFKNGEYKKDNSDSPRTGIVHHELPTSWEAYSFTASPFSFKITVVSVPS